MKVKNLALCVALISAIPPLALAQDVLTGDRRLACEAILCLASGSRPNECTPSIRRYFSISYRKISDTIKGRADFLRLCPAANTDPTMARFVNDLAAGAGRCDAASLNLTTMSLAGSGEGAATYVSDAMPDFCTAYTSNPYTDLSATKPVYVGLPQRGGRWVEAVDYPAALADYQALIATEDAAREDSRRTSGGGQ